MARLPRRLVGRFAPVACLLASFGCDSSDSSSDTPAPVAPPTAPSESKPSFEENSLVLVPTGTRLHAEPSASAWGFDLQVGDPQAAPGSEPHAVVFKVIKEDRAWVELESIEALPEKGGEEDCAPRVAGLDLYHLRFFVPAESLDAEKASTQSLAERFACAEGLVPTRYHLGLVEQLPPLQKGIRQPDEHDKEFELASGAQVYWPDGALAGRVAHTHRFVEAPTEREGRRCFDIRIGHAEKAQLALCAKPEDVAEKDYDNPRARAMLMAKDAGLLGMLNDDAAMFGSLNDESLGALMGTSPGFEGAFDHDDVWGGLTATDADAFGAGGLGIGTHGVGIGGGGTADGLGGLGTKGEGQGSIGAIGHKGGTSTRPIVVSFEVLSTSGAWTPDSAKAMLRRRQNQMRYCYERELKKHPEMADTTLMFELSFDAEGKASAVSVTGAPVEVVNDCIQRQGQRMQGVEGSIKALVRLAQK